VPVPRRILWQLWIDRVPWPTLRLPPLASIACSSDSLVQDFAVRSQRSSWVYWRFHPMPLWLVRDLRFPYRTGRSVVVAPCLGLETVIDRPSFSGPIMVFTVLFLRPVGFSCNVYCSVNCCLILIILLKIRLANITSLSAMTTFGVPYHAIMRFLYALAFGLLRVSPMVRRRSPLILLSKATLGRTSSMMRRFAVRSI